MEKKDQGCKKRKKEEKKEKGERYSSRHGDKIDEKLWWCYYFCDLGREERHPSIQVGGATMRV